MGGTDLLLSGILVDESPRPLMACQVDCPKWTTLTYAPLSRGQARQKERKKLRMIAANKLAAEQMWHIYDSQDQILALAFR